ncbi:MAG TPA: M48 family metalloprotease, partial [Actinomycetes bacterium]|nr:M48 family metalloprotease [Actinomycetes bacterium]
MARTRYPADVGLSSRIVLTLFLLGLLYVAFVAVLVALRIPLVLVLLIAGGFLFFQYFFSDRIALYSMRAHEVSPEQAPELHQMVDRLCALADMPKPRVAIADSDLPNAFATGRNQRHAVVCVTSGVLRRLSAPELEAVLSHELSHVAHRDVAVMTIASFLGILAGFVVRSSIYAGAWGGGGWGRSN